MPFLLPNQQRHVKVLKHSTQKVTLILQSKLSVNPVIILCITKGFYLTMIMPHRTATTNDVARLCRQ